MRSLSVFLLCTTSVAISAIAAPGSAQTVAPAAPGEVDAVPHASAYTAQEGLGEIVVTAQRKQENLQKVPIAITSLSNAQLSQSGVTSILQLPTLSTGLTVQFQAGYFVPRIRGVGTSAVGPGVENPVALYVDGVYYASQRFGPGSFDNVSQIEVLKGPQGTLFGRNTTGGVIQVTTREPTAEPTLEIGTSLDSYLTSRSNVYASSALAANVRSSIFAEFTTQGDGWGKNLATGSDIHKIHHDVELRSKTVWTASDRLSIHLNADYEDRSDNNILNLVPADGYRTLVPGFQRTSNKWDSDNAVDGRERFKGGGGSITIKREGDFADVVSISAYRQYASDVIFGPPSSPIASEEIHNRSTGTQVSQELQLLSHKGGRFNWQAGVYGFYSTERVSPFGITLSGPLAPTPTSAGYVAIRTHAVAKSIAVYGEANTLILPGTHLITGLRYTYEERTFDGSENVTLANGFNVGNVPLPPVAPKTDVGKLSWRFALDHQLTDRILLYASANRGFKSGGYNGLDPTNPPYAPERLDAFQGGVKTETADRRLRVNVEGFHYNYSQIQVSRYTNTAIIYNGGKAKLYGVDVDASAKIGGFLISANLEKIHSEFTHFPDAQYSIPIATGGNILTTGDAKGNQLPFTPDFTATLGVTYSVPISSGGLDLNVTDYHNGGYAFESDNRLKQTSFDTLGASITWRLADNSTTVKIFGTNLLDKAVSSFTVTQDVGNISDFANAPRVVGVEVRHKF